MGVVSERVQVEASKFDRLVLPEGDVELRYPKPLTVSSYYSLQYWMKAMLKKMWNEIPPTME